MVVDYNNDMTEKLHSQFGIGGIVFGNLKDAESLSDIKGTDDLIVKGGAYRAFGKSGRCAKKHYTVHE